MKPLSNTSIAAIFAVGLTGLVGLSLQVPFFKDKETQTTDEMLLLRYSFHQKFAPLKTDPNIVFTGIDQFSLDTMGRWPISRIYHGDFLILLAKESPRAVGWDIFFTEHEKATSAISQAPASAPAQPNASPTDATPAASTSSPPAAASASPVPVPPPASASAAPVPAPTPPPTAPAPAPTTVPTPDAQPTPAAPVNPAPTDTNTAPTTPAAPAASPTAANSILDSMLFGADAPPANANAAPASTPTAAPAPATPDAATTPAAPSNPAPDVATALTEGDQHLVDAASLFPNMVTAAEVSPDDQDPKHPQTDTSMLPTRPLKHVTGDISKLIHGNSAVLPIPELRKETYFGFVNENGENGGGSRDTDPMVVAVMGQVWPSFDLQVLMQYWGIDPDQVTVNLGHQVVIQKPDGSHSIIPIDEKGQMTLNYRARLEDFTNMNYASMIQGMMDKSNGDKSRERDHLPSVKDKIVIVGVTFNGIDSGPTPLDTNVPLGYHPP